MVKKAKRQNWCLSGGEGERAKGRKGGRKISKNQQTMDQKASEREGGESWWL